MGTPTEKVTRKGIDVVVALHVSNSMLAEDLAPNRLERGKQAIAKMIDSMKDDRLGLVVFAGSAYLQMPLSSDYSAAKMMLQTINTDLMPTQGTAIGEAIDVALQAFDTDSGAATTQASEQLKNKAIVILSDGEDHEEGSDIMARKANEAHVAIYTVGVGMEQGGKIPVVANGRCVDFKRDDNGNEVVSKLDENALRDITQIGQGSYFSLAAGSSTEIDRLLAALAQFEKREIDDHVFTDYADQFQYFIALALLLVIAELMLPTIRVKT
ncbi:MAG: VWA domain-containing protein [Sphingobacteriales bacterium]|nr:VWA domain-containing protein [Sphingobacteriales bacterium]